MTAAAAALLASLAYAVILLWARWRFGATVPATVWIRCLLGLSLLTPVTSWTEGWMHLHFVSPWVAAGLIGVREEGLKLLFFLAMADRDPDVRTAGDRFLAMTAVALGFALDEGLTRSMAQNSSAQVLPGLYAAGSMGIAMHVLMSLQVVGCLILARVRSRLWLLGILLPMAVHSIWDNPILIGVRSPGAEYGLRVAIMAGNALLALALAHLAGARPSGGSVIRWAGPSAALLALGAATLLQVAGRLGWHYGLTVRPYAPMMAAWWVVGLDLSILLVVTRRPEIPTGLSAGTNQWLRS